VRRQLGWIGVVRHGQSKANVVRDRAELEGNEVIPVAERDADVELTDLGRVQAAEVGGWLAEHMPQVIVASPFRRAMDTAALAVAEAGRLGTAPPAQHWVDERLRDRELGVLDLLTSHGILARFPDEMARKRHHGKFYHRPPGGESWADVVLRVRFLLAELHDRYPGGRVLLFAHDMTVHALRYILEGVPEPELLRSAAGTLVANGAIAAWEPDETAAGAGYRMVFSKGVTPLALLDPDDLVETPATDDADTRIG
jgi:broad specificity phosphatase PhoE